MSPKKCLPGMLFKVGPGSLNSWKEQIFTPDPILRLPPMELIVQAKLSVQKFSCPVRILVDTGCRISVLFRQKLIPPQLLEKSKRPIKITTADNTPMVGGSMGCFLNIFIPIVPRNFAAPPTPLNFPQVWGYEAKNVGSDVIIGYPFLHHHKLIVDCPSHSLQPCDHPPDQSNSLSSWPTTTRSLYPTPCPTTPTDDPHPRVQQKANPLPNDPPTNVPNGEGEVCRVPPLVSLGSKMKAPRPKDIRVLSSRPASHFFQLLPDSPLHEKSVLPPPSPPSLLSEKTESMGPPGVRGDPLADIPGKAQVCHRAFGKARLSAPSKNHYQCLSCQRVSDQADFDCGCITQLASLFPFPSDSPPPCEMSH